MDRYLEIIFFWYEKLKKKEPNKTNLLTTKIPQKPLDYNLNVLETVQYVNRYHVQAEKQAH